MTEIRSVLTIATGKKIYADMAENLARSFYLEKGAAATRVYERARALEKQYDEIGFVRLRNRPNDEVIMALAMQLEGMKPLIDDGSIMSDPLACPGKYQIDVVNGNTLLINP